MDDVRPKNHKRQRLNETPPSNVINSLIDKGVVKQLTLDSKTTCSLCNKQILAKDIRFQKECGHLFGELFEATLLLWHCNTECNRTPPNGWTYTVSVGSNAETVYVGSWQGPDVLDRLTAHQRRYLHGPSYGDGAKVIEVCG